MITKNYIARSSKRHLEFKDLKAGQIFLDGGSNDLYMKIQEFAFDDPNGDDINAINLETAKAAWFHCNEEVQLINKEINITFSDDDIVDWTKEKED